MHPNRIKFQGAQKQFLMQENASAHIYMYAVLYMDTYFKTN